jgi:hypothetical protein
VRTNVIEVTVFFNAQNQEELRKVIESKGVDFGETEVKQNE